MKFLILTVSVRLKRESRFFRLRTTYLDINTTATTANKTATAARHITRTYIACHSSSVRTVDL